LDPLTEWCPRKEAYSAARFLVRPPTNQSFYCRNINWTVGLFAVICFAMPCLADPQPSDTVTTNVRSMIGDKPEAAALVFDYKDAQQWVDRVTKHAGIPPEKLQLNDKPQVIGGLGLVVPENIFSTGRLERSFTAFSIEAPIQAKLGQSYRYEIQSFDPPHPEVFGLNDDPEGRAKAKIRGMYIRELYGQHYVDTLTSPLAAQAFQIALWKLIHETKPPPFDLKTGAFTIPNMGNAPQYVKTAEGYLKALTGDDAVFYENREAWQNRLLVRLKRASKPEKDEVFGPSLLAFQNRKTESARKDFSASLFGVGSTYNGGGPGAGGNGGNGGNGGGDAGSGSPNNTSPNQSLNPTPPSGGGAPATGFPGAGPQNINPNNIIIHDGPTPNPLPIRAVPAPAGLVLGLVGIGALLLRRRLVQVTQKKTSHKTQS
jgi:hypothetical protein